MSTNSIYHKHIDNLRNAGDAIVSDLKLCFNYGEPPVTQILNSKIQFISSFDKQIVHKC